MECKVLCPSVALLAYLMICQHIRAQCTQPSFSSRNVILTAEHLSTLSFSDGSTVTFECVIGHKPDDLEASKSVTCQGNQWTSLELSCIRKSCGSLPEFLNGRYNMTGNLFGDTAKPVCDKGYMLAGKETTRTCRDQGWDGRDPLCEPVKCSAPPAIENGQLEDEPLESYDYLNAVSYRCNKGLNLIGKSTLHCSEDGTFKPDPPKCFDGCPAPTIPNAKRIGGKSPPYKLGNFIEYKCEDGYTMKGEAYIVCRANGWDPAPPRCIALPTTPTTATTTTTAVTSTVLTTSKALKEKGPGPGPGPGGCPAPAIPNAKITGEKSPHYELGNFIEYKCEDGYTMKGEAYITCRANGWDPAPPRCIEGSSMSTGEKAGIAVGVVALVAIGVLSLVYFKCFKKRSEHEKVEKEEAEL